MTYTLFFIPDYQFQKVFFYVSLGNNFVLFFVETLGNCPVCPLLNPTLAFTAAKLVPDFTTTEGCKAELT